VLPGPTKPIPAGGGRNFDWYQPRHENGNALSYPAITPAGNVDVSADVGPPVKLTGSNPPATLPQPMINKNYFVDRTSTSPSLTITGSTSSGSDTTTSNTLSESADLLLSLKTKVGTKKDYVAYELSNDIKFDNKKTHADQHIATHEVKSASGFTLTQNQAATTSQAYEAATAYYYTQDGTTKVAHAVDLQASGTGKFFWNSLYGGRADPAVELPNRIQMLLNPSTGSFSIPVFMNTPARQRVRGMAFLHPDDPNSPATSGAPWGSVPVAGDQVVVSVRVVNYSLGTPANNVTVRFEAVPVDALSINVLGGPRVIGTTTIPSIAARGAQLASVTWDTTGFGPSNGGGTQQYRVFAIVDPDGAVPNEIHAWKNRYPAYPATTDGTPNGEVLIDPRTGKPETLEAGQNKQGFAEFAVSTPLPSGTVGNQLGVGLAGDGLRLAPGARDLHVDQRIPVLVHLTSQSPTLDYETVLVFDGDPHGGGQLIAGKTVQGVRDRTTVLVEWQPRTPGRHHLVAEVAGNPAELRSGGTQAALDVHVGERALPRASFTRLLNTLNVIALPGPVKNRLVTLIHQAETQRRSGREHESRGTLVSIVDELNHVSSPFVSPFDAGRLIDLAERLGRGEDGGDDNAFDLFTSIGRNITSSRP
jgi:hypothetical protein